MLSKYYSNWLSVLFIIWFIMNKFKIYGYQYINVYYTSIVLLVGYLFYYFYNIIIKQYKYELSFLFAKSITHFIPITILLLYYKKETKYAMETLIIITIVYLIYLNYIKKTMYQVYFEDIHPKKWSDLNILCNSEDGRYVPICSMKPIINKK